MQVFESWGGELSSKDFDEFSLPYLIQINGKVKQILEKDKVPKIIFSKGSWYALDKLCDSGYDGLSLDWLWDPKETVKINKGRVTL